MSRQMDLEDTLMQREAANGSRRLALGRPEGKCRAPPTQLQCRHQCEQWLGKERRAVSNTEEPTVYEDPVLTLEPGPIQAF